MNETIRRGTKEGSGIVVKAPFVHLLKKDIVLMGKSMGVPFELSWSCYREGEKACGVCDSCALRLRAFAEAGSPTPAVREPDLSLLTGGASAATVLVPKPPERDG